jgi:hypothetical protein
MTSLAVMTSVTTTSTSPSSINRLTPTFKPFINATCSVVSNMVMRPGLMLSVCLV